MAADVLVEGAEILEGIGEGLPLEGLFLAISQAGKGSQSVELITDNRQVLLGQFGLVEAASSIGLNCLSGSVDINFEKVVFEKKGFNWSGIL